MGLFGGAKHSDQTAGRGGSLIGAMTIAWDDQFKRNNVMWKVPRNIRMNDNIVVREDEIAVFYRDGKALAYIDKPDRYALTSQNAPIYGWLLKVFTGVQQQAEVFYLQKRVFDAKFGSKQPYQFRDREFGMVNLRLFGNFRYKVISPANFINQFVGTHNLTTAPEIEERIKEQMVVLIYDALGNLKERGMGVADLASNLTKIEQVVLDKSTSHLEMYGLEIDKISGLYISMPEEVQKAVDAKSSMSILGTDYMQYQAGQAMRDAAKAEGGGAGLAGAGVGLGAGMGMGYMMMGAMQQQGQPQQAQPPPQQKQQKPQQGKPCMKCGAIVPPGTKFCGSCGAKQEEGRPCVKCGAIVPPGMKFCGSCGAGQEVQKPTCPKCSAEVPPGTKFCGNCGAEIET